MRLRDILALVALIAVAVIGQFVGEEGASPPGGENPRRPAPVLPGAELWDAETRAWMESGPARRPNVAPDWVPVESQAVVEIPDERSSGSGTAFAVGPGAWLTARHVVDGCDDLGLQMEPRRAMRVTDVRHHPNADVSLLRTARTPTPFATGDAARDGDPAFMVGFPQGQPGAVEGRKIGETVLRERGRFQTRERADVWSERTRVPDRFGSLGGLSGGPVFSADGRVKGVVLAEEPRRGRIFSATVPTMATMLSRGNVTAASDSNPVRFTPAGYPGPARELLTSRRVAKVLCRVR